MKDDEAEEGYRDGQEIEWQAGALLGSWGGGGEIRFTTLPIWASCDLEQQQSHFPFLLIHIDKIS